MQEAEGVRVAAFARDITQQKQMEDEAEKRHRAIMDQLGEAYNETDLRGSYVYVSERFYDLFNVPSTAIRAGVNYEDLYQPEISKFLREAYQGIYKTGKAAGIEYETGPIVERPNMFVEAFISLRKDFRGKPVGFMNIANNCTRRKQAEQELLRTKEAAEAASRAKGEFLANMSHEIRTPLNGVLGMLELASHTDLTPEQKELLEMAESSGSSLLAVINDILDFSKIEAGNLEFDCVEFDLNETLTQAINTMAAITRKKGLSLSHTVGTGVPSFFRGDPVRLKQVLINLLGNAAKFTNTGGVALEVKSVNRNNGKAELEFSVSDTGIGIPPDKQKVIFEAFSQADASTTRKFGGTGLGLAISARIVQLLGGKIWLESEPGRGSVFHFTAALETLQGVNTAPKLPAAVDHQNEEIARFKILLAEDNMVNQKLAVKLLERFGHHVVVANNGKEALLKLEQQDFDLVLMDVQMPEMDGFTATAAIRQLSNNLKATLPIVALTAHAMKEDRDRCLAAGMDDYIPKPINSKQLKETIARVVLPRKHS
jgi:PAS domain S-box-containing protein